MKITLERSVLLRAMSRVARIVENRNTIPILFNVLLHAKGNQLKLKATDLDLELIETVSGDVEVEGGTTVPARTLHDIARKIPDGAQITLKLKDGGSELEIISGRARFVLNTLPESDYPDISEGQFSHSFSLSVHDLAHLIETTHFAISTEETRFYLNGIYLHVVEHDGQPHLTAVATDGHRLAKSQIIAPEGCAEDLPGIIVPRKAVSEIQKLLETEDDRVELQVSNSKLRVDVGEAILITKLIDGTFPNYAGVIPKANDRHLTAECQLLKSAVDRVSAISTERGRAVKLTLDDGVLTLSVSNPNSASATEEIEVDYSAPALEIGFNSRYLLDILDQVTSEKVRVSFAEPGSPTLFHNPSDSGSIFVLMPMRVQ